MSSLQFILSKPEDLEGVLNYVKKSMDEFNGNTKQGSFSAKGVDAKYEVLEREIRISVTHIPSKYKLVPKKKIEEKIKEKFAKAEKKAADMAKAGG
jgi:hypothetical protein